MDWFRLNGGTACWLALVALACQVAPTFGQDHFVNAGIAPALCGKDFLPGASH